MISTKINLTSGEQVTAYYLDERTKNDLQAIIASSRTFATETQLGYTNKRLDNVIGELVRDFYIPKMQKAIVDLLRDKDLIEAEIRAALIPKPEEVTLDWQGFWRAWEGFTKNKVLVPISRGRGKPRLWHLSIRPEEKA